jgi:S-adenosylmethionine decarboxylase
MEIGSEWLVDAAGCHPGELKDVATLRSLFQRIISELDLHPVHEPQFHVFPPPGGVTGFVMLSESHLACHTYPEHGIITLNLYCCRARPDWPWQERLREIVGASDVTVRNFARSMSEEAVPSWR